MTDADYLVRGWRGQRLLLETWHIGEASKNVEVVAWRLRIDHGEASRVEVVDVRRGTTETVYP